MDFPIRTVLSLGRRGWYSPLHVHRLTHAQRDERPAPAQAADRRQCLRGGEEPPMGRVDHLPGVIRLGERSARRLEVEDLVAGEDMQGEHGTLGDQLLEWGSVLARDLA